MVRNALVTAALVGLLSSTVAAQEGPARVIDGDTLAGIAKKA